VCVVQSKQSKMKMKEKVVGEERREKREKREEREKREDRREKKEERRKKRKRDVLYRCSVVL